MWVGLCGYALDGNEEVVIGEEDEEDHEQPERNTDDFDLGACCFDVHRKREEHGPDDENEVKAFKHNDQRSVVVWWSFVNKRVMLLSSEEITKHDRVAEVKNPDDKESEKRVHQVVEIEQADPHFSATFVLGAPNTHKSLDDVKLSEISPIDPTTSLLYQNIKSTRTVSHCFSLREVS